MSTLVTNNWGICYAAWSGSSVDPTDLEKAALIVLGFMVFILEAWTRKGFRHK